MADETPDTSAAPALVALDQAPLSEFVTRREKGETAQGVQAPVPSEIPPKEPDAPEDEGQKDPPPDEKEKKPPVPPGKPKTRFEERLGTLTRQRHDAERALEAERQRAAHLEAELQQFRQSQKPAEQPSPPPPLQPGGPNLDQYLAAGKTYEDWSTANTQYLIAQAIRQRDEQQAQLEQQRQFQQDLANYPERLEAAKQKYADFDDVVLANDRVTLSPVMQAIALRSPHGADIMYWLGTHEAEANSLGDLTRTHPVRPDTYAFVEQHLLMLSGHASNGTSGAKKAVPVSQAPAPISPVGGGTTITPVTLDQAPLGDYIKRRSAEIQKKRTG